MANCEKCIKSDVCKNYEPKSTRACTHYVDKNDNVRYGRWIYDEDYDMFSCSECQCVAPSVNTFEEQFDYDWDENLISTGYEEYTSYIQTDYCPHCGVKMERSIENAEIY